MPGTAHQWLLDGHGPDREFRSETRCAWRQQLPAGQRPDARYRPFNQASGEQPPTGNPHALRHADRHHPPDTGTAPICPEGTSRASPCAVAHPWWRPWPRKPWRSAEGAAPADAAPPPPMGRCRAQATAAAWRCAARADLERAPAGAWPYAPPALDAGLGLPGLEPGDHPRRTSPQPLFNQGLQRETGRVPSRVLKRWREARSFAVWALVWRQP